ncbi:MULTISPECIES: hypothetical protein [unclassified Roseovarius]|uniref:hypothetical protein n=1 Tax=unclassified Roseovarius TaxID=2614913 RepID=UPI00273DF812|nr:hypothetical protein [Roseovarius sp. MMSF_3350]
MKSFLRTTALAAVLSLPLAATADETAVSDISVEADLSSIQNATAAGVWANLPADLESTLAVQLADQIAADGEDGAQIMIDITSVELASSFESVADLADSRISGDVVIERPGDEYDQAYSLTVSAEQAAVLLPAGADIMLLAPGSMEFYNAMVGAFANNIVEKMQ